MIDKLISYELSEKLKNNTRNSTEYEITRKAYNEFNMTFGILPNKAHEFVEYLSNQIKTLDYIDSEFNLVKYLVENEKVDVSMFLNRLDLNGDETKHLFKLEIEKIVHFIVTENPVFEKLSKYEHIKSINQELNANSNLFKVFQKSLYCSYPNIFSSSIKDGMYDMILNEIEKHYNRLMTSIELKTYLNEIKYMTINKDVSSILKIYEQLSNYSSEFIQFNSDVVDEIIEMYYDENVIGDISVLYMEKLLLNKNEDFYQNYYRVYTEHLVENFNYSSCIYTPFEIEVFNDILTYVITNLDNSILSINTETELKILSYCLEKKLLVLQSKYITYYIHPKFMVSDLNRNIWFDVNNHFHYDSIPTVLESDLYNKKHIDYILKNLKKLEPSMEFSDLENTYF